MWWVILTLCIAVIVILVALLRKIMKQYIDMCNVFEELSFFDGDEPFFKDEDVAQRFENVVLLYNVQKGTTDYSIIVDTSKYEKNNLIGLTYIVPAKDYEKLASDVHRNIKGKVGNKLEELELDDEWMAKSIQEAMDGVLVPLCDVYQLKNGRWIWRSKLEERGTF